MLYDAGGQPVHVTSPRPVLPALQLVAWLALVGVTLLGGWLTLGALGVLAVVAAWLLQVGS